MLNQTRSVKNGVTFVIRNGVVSEENKYISPWNNLEKEKP